MSDDTPGEVFAERAPLLDDVALAKIVLVDLLAREVREHTTGVFVYGSFVDGAATLDREGDTSDLDVYVTVAPEGLPTTDGGEPREVSTRFSATDHGLLCRCATHGALDVFGRAEPFDVPLPDVPEPVAESIKSAERAVFHAREMDTELLRFRALDLSLGTAAAFRSFLGDDPRLQVWPLDESDDGAGETITGP